jgi:AraC-like DNA-binding protein
MTDILSELTVTRVRAVLNIYTAPGKAMARKDRPSFAIIYKYEGETEYECDGKTFISNKENAMLLPAGSSYEWRCKESGHYYAVEFDAPLSCKEIFSFPIGGDGERLLRMMRETERKHTLRAAGYHLDEMCAVYSMLLLLLGTGKRTYADAAHRARVAPALDYIAKHYDRDLNNEALAALCGISTVYFRKLFARVVGCSPITYVRGLRIAKAKRMLESDYESLAEIARSLGYADIYTFSKVFKKQTGLSPTAYLLQKRKSQ